MLYIIIIIYTSEDDEVGAHWFSFHKLESQRSFLPSKYVFTFIYIEMKFVFLLQRERGGLKHLLYKLPDLQFWLLSP